jgi:hypothetical protein
LENELCCLKKKTAIQIVFDPLLDAVLLVPLMGQENSGNMKDNEQENQLFLEKIEDSLSSQGIGNI